MLRRDQVDQQLFDPEPERTLHRLLREQKTEQIRNLAIMENNEERNLNIEQNEPQRGRNGNNGRNQAPRPFIQPDDRFMLLDEFVLPPTVVQTAIRRPPIQANNFELKSVMVQMLQNILFHGLPHENPNMHLTNFLEVCDTIKYNGVTEEALKLRLFPLSLGDRAKHWLTIQPPDSITTWNDLVQKISDQVLPTFENCNTCARDQYFWKTRGGEPGRGMGPISRITAEVPTPPTDQMDASPHFL